MARAEIPFNLANDQGQPVVGATVHVYDRGTTTPVAIYAAETGGTTLTNPLTTNVKGAIQGWLNEGAYDLYISGPGVTTPFTHAIEIVPAEGPLTRSGIIHSTSGGFKFPDDTVQTTAAQLDLTTLEPGEKIAWETGGTDFVEIWGELTPAGLAPAFTDSFTSDGAGITWTMVASPWGQFIDIDPDPGEQWQSFQGSTGHPTHAYVTAYTATDSDRIMVKMKAPSTYNSDFSPGPAFYRTSIDASVCVDWGTTGLVIRKMKPANYNNVLAQTSLGGDMPAAGEEWWVTIQRNGNQIIGRLYKDGADPTEGDPHSAEVTHSLVGSDATNWGASVGLRPGTIFPQDHYFKITDFIYETSQAEQRDLKIAVTPAGGGVRTEKKVYGVQGTNSFRSDFVLSDLALGTDLSGTLSAPVVEQSSSTDGFLVSAGAGKTTLRLTSTAASTGITLGGDTAIFRLGTSRLGIDADYIQTWPSGTANQRVVIGNLNTVHGINKIGISLGNDVAIYREAPDQLLVPDFTQFYGGLSVEAGDLKVMAADLHIGLGGSKGLIFRRGGGNTSAIYSENSDTISIRDEGNSAYRDIKARNLVGTGRLTTATYTEATKPTAASAGAGSIIYVSDGSAGNKFQGSDGSAWLGLG